MFITFNNDKGFLFKEATHAPDGKTFGVLSIVQLTDSDIVIRDEQKTYGLNALMKAVTDNPTKVVGQLYFRNTDSVDRTIEALQMLKTTMIQGILNRGLDETGSNDGSTQGVHWEHSQDT